MALPHSVLNVQNLNYNDLDFNHRRLSLITAESIIAFYLSTDILIDKHENLI